MTRWPILPVTLWMLVALLLLSISRNLPLAIWERNYATVHLLQDLDQQRSQADFENRLYLKPGLSSVEFTRRQGNPCQSLWQSRLAASVSLTEAQQLAEEANTCPRVMLIERWQGQLAWLAGERQRAMTLWSALPPAYLVKWGHNLTLADSDTLGQSVLQTAEAQLPNLTLDPTLQTLLYQTLGDLAREEKNVQNMMNYYQKAWEASGYSYSPAYYLGMSYAAQGDCKDAIRVWETGLRNKPNRTILIFDSSYLIMVGNCYGQLGDNPRAQFYLDAAQEVIDSQREAVAPESTTNQQNWLDRVRKSLQEPTP